MLGKFRESLARASVRVLSPRGSRLREDVGVGLGYGAFGYGIDPDDHLYRRITQALRELPPVLQDRALRLSWSLYESNPLAHGIIEMMKDYVSGKGFAVRSAQPEVQAVIDDHWSDSVNQWDIKQHERVRDLSIFGELILIVFVNKADGHVRLASLDPLHVRNIYTDPDNPEVVQTIVVNPRRKVGGLSDSDKFYRVIYLDEEPDSATNGYLVGAREDDNGKVVDSFVPPGSKKHYPYDGSCFYFTVNRVTGAIRGRSDLLSVIDWLDAYDQILFNFIDRTLLMNSFVWDVQLKGATSAQLLRWRQDHATIPKPGTVNVHNENEVWTEVSPHFARAEFDVQAKSIKAQILSAVGLPPQWFGEQMVSRANAAELGAPSMKRLEARQLYVRFVFEHIIRFCLDQAQIAGTLPKEKADSPYKYEVSAPEMSNKDLSQATTSMLNIVQALAIALTANLTDLVEAQRIFVTLAGELGADINLDEMVERMGDLVAVDVNGNPIPGGDGSNIKPTPDTPESVGAIPAGSGVNGSTSTTQRNSAVRHRTPMTIEESIEVLRGFGYRLSEDRHLVGARGDGRDGN